MMMKIILITFLSLVLCTYADKKSFESFKVYDVVPNTKEQVQTLTDLQEDSSYDFWTEVFKVGSKVRVMVNPKYDKDFVSLCESVGMKAEVSIANLEEFINEAMKPTAASSTKNIGSFDWTQYHNIDKIHAWLDELAVLYPNVVSVVNAGNTYEGRPVKGVKIDFKPNGRGENPLSGMIEGGIHAREWISPATVTWIIKEFLTSTDTNIRHMAETFVWHIFPVINPDGYAYTFSNNRMWRKNRNPTHYTNCTDDNDSSRGIDLNRNFDFVWMSVGASFNPCANTYAGPSGSSELETTAIKSYVLNLNATSQLTFYLAFHSYSQMILVPFSHVSNADKLQAGNYGDMYEVAVRAAEKLTAVHGTPYSIGTSGDILYQISGSSMDWVKGVVNVPMSFLFELRDVGQYGFILPTDQIIPNSEEIMACLTEMDQTTQRLGYYSSSGSSIFDKTIFVLLSAMAFLVKIH